MANQGYKFSSYRPDEGIGARFQKFLGLREQGAERTRLCRLGDRLRKRLRQLLASEVSLNHQGGKMDNHTDRINRLLLLWLDLQAAMRRSARRHAVPWDCPDGEVARLWKKITDPENQRALEEWLYQIAPGKMELWAQRALLECRRRSRSEVR